MTESSSEERTREYRKKRSLERSGEPEGGSRSSSDGPIFVVHEHDASSHHFDLRLEIDGGLESWAVPKGPSTDPSQKRLAIRTEVHPLEYADFEGTIPEGEYGAGTVVVWDRGPLRNAEKDDDGEPVPLAEQLEDGHLTVELEGEKLRGGWALTRIEKGEDEKWLLVKMDDADADARRRPTSTEPESVVSGRTVEEVAGDAGKETGEGSDKGEGR